MNPAELFSTPAALDPNAGKAQEQEAMPEGVYPLVVESCEQRKYVDGKPRKPEDIAEAVCADPNLVPGEEVSVTFVVTEGKFAKRKLFGSFCIKASSNQRSYGDFGPEQKVAAGINDLCGLRKRLGTPEKWSDWNGKVFMGYVTAKKGKDKVNTDGSVTPGKVRNDVRCTVKDGEENAPRPSAPADTTTVRSDEAPF